MSIDPSLKTKGKLTEKRSVFTRAERVQKLEEDKKSTDEKTRALGLAKTRVDV